MTLLAGERRTWAVSDELVPLTVGPIDRTTLALYAGGSGDHNPIHLDPDIARSAGHPDVFVHGMLSMALLGRMLTNNLPTDRLRRFSARFVAITPVGATITCTGRAAEVTESSVRFDLSVSLPDGTVMVAGTAEVDL